MSSTHTLTTRLDASTGMDLYRVMLKIRLAEQRIASLYPSDKIQSPVHLSIGQEAVSAGVCRALRATDHVYGTYRGHGLFISKGGDLKAMFAELYGKDTGCARGMGGSMHLVAPEVGLMGCSAVVASTIPVATGDALASTMQGRPRVVAAVFGDGAVDEGVFFESVNFAVLRNLPIIYVCENNGLAVHSKVSDRRRQTELFRIAEGLGLLGQRHDGGDVGVVYTTMAEAVERVRQGGGPALMEYITYRWYDHVGPGTDYHETYRDPLEAAHALSHDPLERAKAMLVMRLGVTETTIRQWEHETHREIDEAVAFAERSPFPSVDRLSEGLYADQNEAGR